MIDSTKISKKKMAAGAALVALSGFVPQPLMQQAHAAAATINVTGSFITGITLNAGRDAQFGVMAASDVNGTVTLSTAGAVTFAAGKGVTVGGAPQAGSFAFTAVSTVPNIDITVAGLGAVALAASANGLGPIGTAKLSKIVLGGLDSGAAQVTLTDGGSGTAKVAGYDFDEATATIDVGAQLTWTTPPPIGSFTAPITLTISY
jgi:hypothetical protein